MPTYRPHPGVDDRQRRTSLRTPARSSSRIAADTGIRFTTYLYYDCIGPEGAADLDPEIYEKPLGSITYR
jgi:hypothetical protein